MKNVGLPKIKCASIGSLNHVRPIQRFLKVRSGSLTFLERSSGFLRCFRCVDANVTSSISFGTSRASGFFDFTACTSLLLRLFAALPFHSAILKPDLHLQRKYNRVIIDRCKMREKERAKTYQKNLFITHQSKCSRCKERLKKLRGDKRFRGTNNYNEHDICSDKIFWHWISFISYLILDNYEITFAWTERFFKRICVHFRLNLYFI